MSCCAPGVETVVEPERGLGLPASEELWLASRSLGGGLRQTELSVPGVHCGACITAIEGALRTKPEVERARVNLSSRRVSIVWKEEVAGKRTDPRELARAIRDRGYEAHLFAVGEEEGDAVLKQLIRAVAVAGFAATNIMLLSVSVWSGADAATRDLFHWISAMIAAPALVYAGRFFYQSAWNALRHGRTNMDVPIALAVTLSYGMSLHETIGHGEHAWFDASVTLLFFLLIGRTLDHMMRGRARSAISGLARLSPRGAMVVNADGSREYRPVEEIRPGERLMIAAGERIPVDGRVLSGASDLDRSVVNGESAPVAVGVGDLIQAGTLNLTGPLTLEATAAARDSFLAEIMGLMEAAEGGRARYRRIADRAARYYSPAVHLLALLTFIGWMFVEGDVRHALLVAVAVLIITCPCALGLAVPVVQVVAAGRLFQGGVMVKDGSAMERLAEIDTVLFDKTGTLTIGEPRLVNADEIAPAAMAIAAALAAHSRHPVAKALHDAAGAAVPLVGDIREIAGAGIEADTKEGVYRLGSRAFACGGAGEASRQSEAVLSVDGRELASFRFEDKLRAGAGDSVAELHELGLETGILSGDREPVVAEVGRKLGIRRWIAELSPRAKVEACAVVAEGRHRVLMVGDGINDAPALRAAHVSMAPASAADVGRQASDFVFMHQALTAVPFAIETSRQAGRLIRQNFALAIGYNLIAVPIAILGYATPLVAAIAMSTSSVIVVANALRLRGGLFSEPQRRALIHATPLPAGDAR
ncbi:cation-translocating P-type ATPase [Sinorhizobium alkalisoli]|uniref:Nitrogen fixation protein FixI n=1 Tax=Sinorhizobium alkalisoli TaxID=1752398 RepID=A0A1E3VCC1_9HYPH|nr:cation-translocating P-type ATPase [Sinorhizobium alkalisoli]MCA1493807.1 cadmium-translocating P-type ATPase [Ensifer sp. NBAIM29]MCG5479661.1 cadmium-translocating P-type ATPase [Sinorhizobium alkalisoli]ODR91230.1 nitrogen fixation protein FixI [Sinorhizobium alkalisoli]